MPDEGYFTGHISARRHRRGLSESYVCVAFDFAIGESSRTTTQSVP